MSCYLFDIVKMVLMIDKIEQQYDCKFNQLIFIRIQARRMQRNYGKNNINTQPKPTQPQFIPKQLSKQQMRQWQSTFNLIALFLKNNNRTTTALAFNKVRKFYQIKKKYSSFLLNKLHLLQKRKSREYLKLSLSALQSNRINYYTNKKLENDRIKELLKSKAINLFVIISNKLEKNKKKNYFLDLKARGALKAKFTTFKTTLLYNRISSIYLEKLRTGFTKIGLSGKRKLQSMRRISRLEKFSNTKLRNNLLFSILKLKINVIQSRLKEQKQKEEKVQPLEQKPQVKPAPVAPQIDRQSEQQIRKLENQIKNLTEKKKNLERDVSKLEAESDKMVNDFKKQIKRLQSENEELGFNNGILEESNQELERQLQNRQKSSRKKLSKSQIWQNIYNNLIHFLAINKDKEITKAALLESLQIPLVPCNINLQELNDQNKVLSQLLEQYKKNFPEPTIVAQNEAQLLPFDVIRKQNKYYYMVLQVLCQWGASGSKELEQLTNDLTILQKKLGS